MSREITTRRGRSLQTADLNHDESTRRRKSSVDRSTTERPRERSTDSESSNSASSSKGNGIRTRLSTGSIHMNGTITIAVAKEIENNQKLSGTYKGSEFKESPSKTVSQSKKHQGDSVETSQIISTPAVTPPLTTFGRKRGANTTPVEPAAVSAQVIPPKRRKIGRNDGSGEDNRNDYFCWLCHKEGTVVCCELCPRVYHSKCLELGSNLPQDWVCPECEKIMRAECIDTRSKAMSMITLDTLCTLLKYALERMKHQGCNPFEKPVDTASVAHYTDYIFNPMDLSQLERNIKKKMYGCTEAFLADAKWILHNCIIFNGTHHKLTSSAKMIIKICKHEMSEIELCPDCYLNSCIRKNDEWFSETCRTPHPLVWAKLKGYPFWPAKALREVDGQVDVRFFGAHDRSWVPTSAVFLLCKDIPTPIKKGRGGFENAMDELEKHIEKLSAKFGKYEFAPFRTPYDQRNVYSHVKLKSKTMKRLGRKQKLGGQKPKIEVKGQFGLNKLGGRILGQTDRQSVVSKTAFAVKNKYMSVDSKQGEKTTATKTASALKNKYNSIITTRRGLLRTNSDSSSSNNISPVKKMVLIPISAVDDIKDLSSVMESKSERDKNVGSVSTLTEFSEDKKNVVTSEAKCVKTLKTDIVDKIKEKMDMISDDENVMDDDKHVTDNNQSVSFKKEDRVYQREITPDKTVISDTSVLQQTSPSKTSDVMTSADSSLVNEDGAKISKSTSDKQELSDLNPTCVKDEHDSDKEKAIASDDSSSSPSPSKKKYLENLQKTIESCKNKLGIVGENDQFSDNDDIDDEDDDDDEEEEDNDDDDEKMSDDGKQETDDKKVLVVKSSKNDTDDNDLKNSDSVQKETEKDIAKVSVMGHESEGKEDSKEGVNETEKSNTMDSRVRTKTPESITNDDNQKDLSSSDVQTPSVKNSTEKETVSLDSTEKDESKIQDMVEKSDGDKESVTETSGQTSDKSNSESRTEPVDEPGLMMEVESESDNERLMIDMEEERMKTCTPTKIRQNSSESKTSNKASDDLDDEESKEDGVDDEGADKADDISGDVITAEKSDSKITDVKNMDVDEDGEKSPKERISADLNKCSNITTESLVKKFKIAEGKMIIHPSFMQKKKSASPPQSKKTDTTSSEGKKSTIILPKFNVSDTEGKKSTTTLSRSEADSDAKKDLVDQFTKTLMSRIEGTFQDVCTEFVNTELQPKDNDETESLKAELNKVEWEQQQQLYELKHNFQLTISEMKACWEAEKQRLVAEVKSMCEKEKETVVAEAKKKQWCANCGKEAIFYCCWNTSYCDYPCQQSHWPQHMPNCMQSQQQNNENTESGDKTKSPNEKTSDRVESSPISSDPGSRPPSNRQSTPVGQPTQQVVISSPSIINNNPTPVNIQNTNIHQPVEVNDYRRQQSRDNLAAALQRQEEHRQIQYLHGSPAVQTSPDMSMQYMPIRPSIPPGNSPYRYGQGSPSGNKTNNWTEEALNNACLAVTQGGVSVNKAAKVYRVPRQKLSERVSGKQQPQQAAPNSLSGQPIIHTNQGMSNQPVRLQYVQPPQPAMSIPHAAQQYSSPVRMQAVQIQNQPMPGSMISQRPMMQQNNSMVYPLHLRQSHPGAMIPPGNQLVITQQGQRPPPPNVMPANVPYRY